MVLAQEEARLLNHNFIGTEHLLLGLLHEGEGIAAQALTSTGVTLESARGQVMCLVDKGEASPSGHIPFTPRAKKTLELGLRESLQLGQNYIGTEHILLGVLREGAGMACQALAKLDTDLNLVRIKTLELIGNSMDSVEQAAKVAAKIKMPTPNEVRTTEFSGVHIQDSELSAMASLFTALRVLSPDARGRVLRWAQDRYGK